MKREEGEIIESGNDEPALLYHSSHPQLTRLPSPWGPVHTLQLGGMAHVDNYWQTSNESDICDDQGRAITFSGRQHVH